MSLQAIGGPQKLLNPAHLALILGELQGLRVDVVDGAAAGTAMNVAALRENDTIIQAIKFNDTWAAPTSDLANITIQSTKAKGTLTISGNPVDGDTFVVNDITYTFKTTPTDRTHVKITTGNNTQMAADVVKVVNAYEARYESALNGDSNRTPQIVASSNAGVVTFTSLTDGVGNGVVVTGTVTVLAASGSGSASATLTAATVVADNTCVVSGVTFTAKATPTLDTQFAVKANNTDQATEIARCINAYQYKYGTLGVKATSALAVVTLTPIGPKKGNIITLTENASNVAVSGSGTLAGGTATGSIKSTTDLSAATLVLVWFKKAA